MKTFVACFAFCLLLLSNVATAQTNITGNWKVVTLSEAGYKLSAEGKEKLETLRKLYFNSTFHFYANNRFDYKILEPQMEVKDAKWTYDAETSTYRITGAKDNTLLMEIKVTQAGDKTAFSINEVPLVFEVVKF